MQSESLSRRWRFDSHVDSRLCGYGKAVAVTTIRTEDLGAMRDKVREENRAEVIEHYSVE